MTNMVRCRRVEHLMKCLSNRVFHFLFILIAIRCVSSTGDRNDLRSHRDGVENDVQSKSLVFKLSQQRECADDIRRLCRNVRDNNFAILDCLQSERQPQDVGLSTACDHLLWIYKKNLTSDDRFSEAARQVCDTEPKLRECQKTEKKPGYLLACLMDQKENMSIVQCKQFLTKMESIVFSDYRLIYKFVEKCEADIKSFQCGRLGDTDYKPHSQGETIECLQQKMPELNEDCRHEITRISELQADDFNLDRALYFACRNDRERFCVNVNAGEGRVYKCLLHHKTNRLMSSECKEKLIRRQKLVAQDYKVSKGLAKACREDIKLYKCRDETSKNRVIRLSQILICLENALHRDQVVSSDCQAEMMDHRKSVMEDYQISPDLVNACHADISTYCAGRIDTNGKTIHCLMEHAKPTTRKQKRISDQCIRELEKLLQETDAAEDWRVDPVLKETCQSVVDLACKDIRPGDGRVLSCLMEKIGSDLMTDECQRSLLQIQYFVARNFKLDSRLYKACRSNAISLCGASENWVEDFDKIGPERGPLLPCLFRNAYHPLENVKLASGCLQEIRRVMRQRAISVDLHPEIVEPCMEDLASTCNKTAKGEELVCLQDNLEKLSIDCKKEVSNYVEEEAEHAELNVILYKACEPLIQKYCEDILKKDTDEGDIMQCLVEHKNDYETRQHPKCRAAIEHFQIISLKDFKFSFKFKEACKQEVVEHCKNIRSKAEVVHCLSEMVRNDTLLEQAHRVSLECRQHLRFELLQRSEDIELDPYLATACKEDRVKFCKDYPPGNAMVLECLKSNRKRLSHPCHVKIFNREQDEMIDNSIDYTLLSSCKRMIKIHCSDVEMADVLNCLRRVKDEIEFDGHCREIVLRRIAQQNSDYRLNLMLRKICKSDLHKYCENIINSNPKNQVFYNGKVIECLKDKFLQHKLNDGCHQQIAKIITDSQLDFRQDPILSEKCKTEISTLCKDEDDAGRGRVEECLKMKFQSDMITNIDCKRQIAKLLQQGNSDINADPILYKACALDLRHRCYNIPSGDGQQLACLIEVLNSKNVHLQPYCHNVLSKRVKMFEHAAKVMPPESIQDLYIQVAHSPARNYFIVVTFAMLGMIFFGGLFCGRITKRVRAEIKNK